METLNVCKVTILVVLRVGICTKAVQRLWKTTMADTLLPNIKYYYNRRTPTDRS